MSDMGGGLQFSASPPELAERPAAGAADGWQAALAGLAQPPRPALPSAPGAGAGQMLQGATQTALSSPGAPVAPGELLPGALPPVTGATGSETPAAPPAPGPADMARAALPDMAARPTPALAASLHALPGAPLSAPPPTPATTPGLADLPAGLQTVLNAAGYARPAAASTPEATPQQAQTSPMTAQPSLPEVAAANLAPLPRPDLPAPVAQSNPSQTTADSAPGYASPTPVLAAPAPSAAPPVQAMQPHAQPTATAPLAQLHVAGGQISAAPPAQTGPALLPQVAPSGHAAAPELPLAMLGSPLLAPALAMMLDNLPPFVHGRPPVKPLLTRLPERARPLLWLSDVLAGLESNPSVSFTDNRPVPLDIFPARQEVACWRLDDTTALVSVEDDQAAAARRAATLHAELMAAGQPLAALHPGEGFATWQGSPLWLRLAGIAKPASLGVLLAESSPARVEVVRTAAQSWRTRLDRGDQGGHATAHDTAHHNDPGLCNALLYGTIATAGSPLDAAAARASAMAATACRAALAGAPAAQPRAWRSAEAWCALARSLHDVTPADHASDVALAVLHGHPQHSAPSSLAPVADPPALLRAVQASPADAWRHLRALGQATLARIIVGDVRQLGRIEGLSLAMALGRLNDTPLALGVT